MPAPSIFENTIVRWELWSNWRCGVETQHFELLNSLMYQKKLALKNLMFSIERCDLAELNLDISLPCPHLYRLLGSISACNDPI
jgi:hypothetical protein